MKINDKPLKYRIVKESLQEDVDYYFKHLEDDGFIVMCENDYIRVFKPLKILDEREICSYLNFKPFQWNEIAVEISRYVNELDDNENNKSFSYAYVIDKSATRKQITKQSLIDENFDCGEILSFVIGFK